MLPVLVAAQTWFGHGGRLLFAVTRFTYTEHKTALTPSNGIAAVAVAFTSVINLLRGWPVVSLLATLIIAAALHLRWTRAGRRAASNTSRPEPIGETDAGWSGPRGRRAPAALQGAMPAGILVA
ncbi:hypothetical protein [Streptomyces sp. NBC_01198]|uniref:hypothetical protein n=1 Tax=Streptomyces sp. NBC_01198 TaxID=2903769 RepID=UPI002E0D47E1|nr:hypothetical protein OG702_06425 [Streptomyces sp. NBC_01198]